MAQEVYMDVAAVENMSKQFGTIGNVLKGVSNALEVAMNILKGTAFIGLVGGIAVERYIASLKPIIDDLSKKSIEIGGDLAASARAYQNGDAQGSTRFY